MYFSQFSHSVVSDSLQPHEAQHARPPCPSPIPGVHSDSRSSSQWCHPAISSSVVPFYCPQYLPIIFLNAIYFVSISPVNFFSETGDWWFMQPGRAWGTHPLSWLTCKKNKKNNPHPPSYSCKTQEVQLSPVRVLSPLGTGLAPHLVPP